MTDHIPEAALTPDGSYYAPCVTFSAGFPRALSKAERGELGAAMQANITNPAALSLICIARGANDLYVSAPPPQP